MSSFRKQILKKANMRKWIEVISIVHTSRPRRFSRKLLRYELDLAKAALRNNNYWGVYNVFDSTPYTQIVCAVLGEDEGMMFLNRIYLAAKQQNDPQGKFGFNSIDSICSVYNLTPATDIEIAELTDALSQMI